MGVGAGDTEAPAPDGRLPSAKARMRRGGKGLLGEGHCSKIGPKAGDLYEDGGRDIESPGQSANVPDIMLIRVKQGKGRKDRYTILPRSILQDLRSYWKAYRPSKCCSLVRGRAAT